MARVLGVSRGAEPRAPSGGTPGALESGRHTIGRMVELAQRPVQEGTLAATAAPADSMGALMRPSLNILGDELTGRIVDEAKRVLAEVGMEIRGPEMRRRLIEHGLPTNPTGERVLFPRDVVEAAIASAPEFVHALRPRRRAAR